MSEGHRLSERSARHPRLSSRRRVRLPPARSWIGRCSGACVAYRGWGRSPSRMSWRCVRRHARPANSGRGGCGPEQATCPGTPAEGVRRPGPRSPDESPATPSWSWRPWPSAPSPPLCSKTASAPRGRRRQGPGSRPGRPGHHRADRPGHRAPAYPARPARQRRLVAGLAATPPGTRPLVPPAHTTCPRLRDCPGQLTNGCCPN